MIVPLSSFVALAQACAPAVHVETLAAVARTESRFDSLAINDNTARRRYRPTTREQAVAIANTLLARRHSLDLGLMQVNSTNLPRLGMTVADAFDPCRSIAGGARVLTNFYRLQSKGADPQPALLRAVSSYNTGSPSRGFANGYVGRVQASAEMVVPAIRTGAGEAVAGNREGEAAPSPVVASPAKPMPAAWDVYGRARALREGGDAPAAGQGGPVLLQIVGSADDAR